jgi:STE24 endopeptidase
MHPLIDEQRQILAKRYHKDNMIISIISYIISVVFLLVLLYFGISKNFLSMLNTFTEARFVIILLYFAALYVTYSIITFPLSYIDGYKIEHKYEFSTQNLNDWFKDWLKSFLVTFIIGLIVLEAIYFVTNISPDLWWLWLSILMIIFSGILINLFPVLIIPLFYKTSPIENEGLKEKIGDVCYQTRININGVFSINLSSKTTKANAAVVGLGNTKRILIGDTLIEEYNEDEILSVLAHEITHYKEHHIWWLIFWQSVITLVMFYAFYHIYPYFYKLAGFDNVNQIAAFPLFVITFAVLSFILRPLSSAISRYFERKADLGALNLTNNPDSFISLIAKFCNKQLSLAYPNPTIEWYKYSHPSPGNRIKFAENWRR